MFLPVIGLNIFSSGIIDPTITGNIMSFGGGILDELEPYVATFPEASDLQNGFLWVGIIIAILYGLNALFLFIGGIRVMTGSKELEKTRKKWLTGGISRILSQIVVILLILFLF